MIKPIPVLVVAGPTAVGKTEFAINLAKKTGGEIIGCDSMQIYKFMDIGSAKPTVEERREVPHHLIDFVDPRNEFSVARYQNLARTAIEGIDNRGNIPIISGGTGLFLDSIIYDMDFSQKPEGGIFNRRRDELFKVSENHGNEALHDILVKLSPETAAKIHPNNVKKVVRAIEVLENGGNIPDYKSVQRKKFYKYDTKMFCLTRDRNELYDRINKRVDVLMNKGLLGEIENLLKMGLSEKQISMKGIGYKELFSYLNGETDLEEAVRLIKRNTRRFAKRQLTWFRRYDNMEWINLSRFKDIDEAVNTILEEENHGRERYSNS